jgi:AraC-like DNA-binding protein
VDEAREIFGRFNTPIKADYLDRRTPFEWRGNAARIGPVLVAASQYGGSAQFWSEAVEGVFTMTFPLASAGGEGSDGRTKVAVAKGQTAWMASPLSPSTFRYGTGYRGLHVTIPRAVMEGALAALGCRPDRKVLRFDTRLSVSSGPGAAVERLLRFAADEANRDDHAFSSPLVATRFVDSVLFTLLLGQPNSFSSELQAPPRSPEPRHVSRAAEYLEANAARPVRMADLVQITGVSARTLQVGFLKHRGCTPMAFLRDRRLMLARTKLLTGSGSTVTQIALDCGFEHLGRFSARYQARFGEAPSDTQLKAR